MVTQDSATMIDGRIRIGDGIPLDADHSTMVKYGTQNDPVYRKVLPEVEWMVQRALHKLDGAYKGFKVVIQQFHSN